MPIVSQMNHLEMCRSTGEVLLVPSLCHAVASDQFSRDSLDLGHFERINKGTGFVDQTIVTGVDHLQKNLE